MWLSILNWKKKDESNILIHCSLQPVLLGAPESYYDSIEIVINTNKSLHEIRLLYITACKIIHTQVNGEHIYKWMFDSL